MRFISQRADVFVVKADLMCGFLCILFEIRWKLFIFVAVEISILIG